MFVPSWLSQCCQGAACPGYLVPSQSLKAHLGLMGDSMWQQIQISHLHLFLAPKFKDLFFSLDWSLKHRRLGILWLPGWRQSSMFLFMLWHLFLTERLFESAVQDSSLLWIPLIKASQMVDAGESHLVNGAVAAASSVNSRLKSFRHFLKMIAAGDCWSVLAISVFFQSWHRVLSCSVLAKLNFTQKNELLNLSSLICTWIQC